MNLLLNGNCNSRGPDTWPYYLQGMLGCNLVNLSVAGAGNAYIHETTISELARRSYDFVLIMWGESIHTGVRAKGIDRFSDSENTALYQSKQNDWPGKITYPINDQDYVDKKWIVNAGYLAGKQDSVAKFFQQYHDTVGFEQTLETDIIRQVSLQGYLKSIAQPYVFLYGRPYTKFKRFEHLYNLIDWSNFYQEHTLMQIASQNNNEFMGIDNKYPNPVGQKIYAQVLSRHLIKSFDKIFTTINICSKSS